MRQYTGAPEPIRINVSSRIDLLTLRLFVAIVEERSIARAADREGIAASAVSKRIGDLEQALRTELLLRHRQGIEPTAAGQALLQHARLIMRNLAELEAELVDFSAGTRGQVRICANESTLFGFIPEQLARFAECYPDVRVELQSNLSPMNIQAVMDNSADIGIFSGDLPTGELVVHSCFKDRLVVVVPAGHTLAKRDGVGFAELLGYDLIEQEPRSSIQTLLLKNAGGLGNIPRSRVRVGGFDAVCRMVEAGLGLGIIPDRLAAKLGPVMDIAIVALEEDWAVREHKICVRNDAELPVATRLLLRHLLEAAQAS
ncbi:LysR family transcriptional regulator [Bradyrhizobium sp. CCGUVB1N3]|uniref:LysR family transcriptional regulator n=1 Tax=Bradyrhizobium sp. CCGUVB1N3 TaxID=2949629 RepID=UPI0020B1E010|nr:LysR family transcriptional regulator [Bradyrhizobium sp. CCGUVB1N3]MCP3469063.1 LysR family transcriptional regulator [Bradyrhizobium sp. CCGUVB1N3]